MSTRDQKPKRKKTKRSSIQDCIERDSPYRAPHNRHLTPEESDSDVAGSLRRNQKHRKPNLKKSAVQRPRNKNAKDPFDCLNDDVVGIIISLLPVQATETLRRVSKLWKATSEYHNDTQAIRRHFSHIGEGLKSFASREEVNLHFRRLLYHQESLKAGFATRALQCSGTKFWHVNNGTLMWASSLGSISLRRLRSQNGCRSVTEEVKELDLHGTWPEFNKIIDAQITDSGEILTHVDIPQLNTTWAKLSQGGRIVWQVTTPGSVHSKNVRAAVGKETIYTIDPQPRTDYHIPGQQSKKYLVARSLVDGAVLHQRLVQPLDDEHERLPGDLQLASDEGWAVFKRRDRDVHIFATTGHGFTTRVYNVPGSTIVRSKVDNQMWVVNYSFSDSTRSVLLSPKEERVGAQPFLISDRYFSYTKKMYDCGVGFDPDRMLLFRILLDPLPVILVIKLTRDEECVHHLRNHQNDVELRDTLIEGRYGRGVTLPALPAEEPGARRDLNISLPWTTRNRDYFGVMDDYVVYHSVEDEMLLVLDFWPVW